MKTKSALSYFGSDASVAADLASLLDGCKHVTIPFVGGASIIPRLQANGIVANDLNDLAINFYRVLTKWEGEETRASLIDKCRATLSHPFNLTEALKGLESPDPAIKAWAYWATCWLARKGQGGTKSEGGGLSYRWRANGGSNASRIKSAAEGLCEWSASLTRCEWICESCFTLLGKVRDDGHCGVYCDPPWVSAGDVYKHRSTELDHFELAQCLERFEKTRVVVRYGDHPLIRDLYKTWSIIEASSRTQANSTIGEIWITNFEVSK